MDSSNSRKNRAKCYKRPKAALRSGHQRFTPEHLFAALLEEASIVTLLETAGADITQLEARTKGELLKLPRVEARARKCISARKWRGWLKMRRSLPKRRATSS